MTAADLRAERARSDLSQRDLAARAGVAVSTLCALERGRQRPRRATLRAIEAALRAARQAMNTQGEARAAHV